jgi:ribosomal protein S18 acetylase RimI-like enzyme
MHAEMKGMPLAWAQVKPVARLMARAFDDDPFFTFVLPNARRRSRCLPWIFERTIRYGQRYGKVYTTPSLEGIALWLGPDHPGLGGLGTILSGLFLMPLQMSWFELQRSLRLAGSADRLHKQAIQGRHWYLLGLGVEPALQGLGVGRALMQPVLVQADRQGLSCYLDTNNEKNLKFYERVGFKLAGHSQAGHKAPPTWAMLRKPGQ